MRLDRYFRVFENHKYPHIDPAADQSDLTRVVEPEGQDPFILHPGEFVLGSTYEVVTLPDDIAARVEAYELAARMQLSAPEVSDLSKEDPATLDFYGATDPNKLKAGYARNCLALAGTPDPGPVDPAVALLLLTGDEDKVGPPEASRALAEAHGSATVEVFDGCGHWTAIEKPAEVTDHLLKFF